MAIASRLLLRHARQQLRIDVFANDQIRMAFKIFCKMRLWHAPANQQNL